MLFVEKVSLSRLYYVLSSYVCHVKHMHTTNCSLLECIVCCLYGNTAYDILHIMYAYDMYPSYTMTRVSIEKST